MHIRKLILGAAAAALALAVPAALPAQVAASADWAAKTVPIEEFGKFPSLFGPRISPGGKIIAAKVRSGGVQALAIIPLGGKAEVIARDGDFDKDKVGEKEIVAWNWVDDEHLLITIRSRDNYMGRWYDNSRIASFNIRTHKLTPLGWENALISAGNVLWSSPPGAPNPRLLLERQTNTAGTERADNPEVIEIDSLTGEFRVLVRPTRGVSGWTADEAGVVRFGSSYDRDTGRVQILYRPDGKSQFKTIIDQKNERYDDLPLPSVILAGSNKAYAASNQDGYRAIYEYDLATMKLGKKLFAAPGYDMGGLSTTPDGTALQSYGWTDQRARTVYLDPRLKEINALLEESFGKGNVRIASADAKREKIIFLVAELGQVPSYYLFDTVTGGINRLAWYNDALKNAKLNQVSMIRYPASDGKSIEAVLTMPRHKAGEKNLPLVVLPHGGPWARDDADWDPFQWAQALAEWGYVVIQPNYRGSDGYGKEWEKASDGNWGHRMQDDLNDAVAWLAGQGIADPKRACIMGWSYGGYAASRAAQRDGAKWRCAISGAGVHDLPAMVDYDRDYLGAYGAKTALGAAGTLREVSPGLFPEQYSTPILIIHGEKDVRVPVAQSRGLVARLKRAGKVEGKDYEYLEQPLNTHNLLREADRLEVLKRTKAFLDKHNPA